MATKTTTLLIDDLDGKAADETIGFALDGVEYEIDLHGKHAKELRQAMSAYIDVARRVGGRRGPVRRMTKGRGTDLAPEERTVVRAWAAANGLSVSERGRIAASLIDQWIAAGRPRP